MLAPARTLPTIGEISRRHGAPIHRVEYVIRSRNIEPIGVAGNARIFAESDVAFIGSELKRIEAGRQEAAK